MKKKKLFLQSLFFAHLFCVSLGLYAHNQNITQNITLKNYTQQDNDRFFSEVISSLFSSQEASQTTYVRRGAKIGLDEQKAHAQRLTKNKKALERYTHQELDYNHVPKIGIVCSGGGFRAAVATLGMLEGLDEIGLLDATRYISALSGSTWSIASWMLLSFSLKKLEVFLQNKLRHAFSLRKINEEAVAMTILSKVKSGRSITLNDIWGGILGDVFFDVSDNGGQKVKLSDIAFDVAQGKFPIPLFTGVLANTAPDYTWLEFSPFEIGSTQHQTWIPTSAFGKKFKNGATRDAYEGETFGYMLGMFGSAYAASCYDAVNVMRDYFEDRFNLAIPSPWFSWFAGTWFGSQRISPPKISNFMYKIDTLPFSNNNQLKIVDAGVHFNLPFPPLFRRNMDIYIVCDASGDALYPGGHTMKQVKNYAESHGIALPYFDYKTLTSQSASVIVDENNPDLPIIIYIPNFVKISTLDFNYSEKEFSSLLNGIKTAITQNSTLFKKAINYSINTKKLRNLA